MLHDVESRASLVRLCHDLGNQSPKIAELERPILGILNQPGLHGAKYVREVAAETETGLFVHRQQPADLVITEAINVEFIEIKGRVVDEELTHIVIP